MRPAIVLLVASYSAITSAAPALRWPRVVTDLDYKTTVPTTEMVAAATSSSCIDAESSPGSTLASHALGTSAETSSIVWSYSSNVAPYPTGGYSIPILGTGTSEIVITDFTHVTTTTCPFTKIQGSSMVTLLTTKLITLTDVVTSCAGGCPTASPSSTPDYVPPMVISTATPTDASSAITSDPASMPNWATTFDVINTPDATSTPDFTDIPDSTSITTTPMSEPSSPTTSIADLPPSSIASLIPESAVTPPVSCVAPPAVTSYATITLTVTETLQSMPDIVMVSTPDCQCSSATWTNSTALAELPTTIIAPPVSMIASSMGTSTPCTTSSWSSTAMLSDATPMASTAMAFAASSAMDTAVGASSTSGMYGSD